MSLDTHRPFEHVGVVGSSQSRDRIPSLGSIKALSFAHRIRNHPSLNNIVEHVWILVKSRVRESDGRLARRNALFVDPIEHGGNNGGRHRGTTDHDRFEDYNNTIGAYCRNIRKSVSATVVHAASFGNRAICCVVTLPSGIMIVEVCRDGCVLIVRPRPKIIAASDLMSFWLIARLNNQLI